MHLRSRSDQQSQKSKLLIIPLPLHLRLTVTHTLTRAATALLHSAAKPVVLSCTMREMEEERANADNILFLPGRGTHEHERHRHHCCSLPVPCCSHCIDCIIGEEIVEEAMEKH